MLPTRKVQLDDPKLAFVCLGCDYYLNNRTDEQNLDLNYSGWSRQELSTWLLASEHATEQPSGSGFACRFGCSCRKSSTESPLRQKSTPQPNWTQQPNNRAVRISSASSVARAENPEQNPRLRGKKHTRTQPTRTAEQKLASDTMSLNQ